MKRSFGASLLAHAALLAALIFPQPIALSGPPEERSVQVELITAAPPGSMPRKISALASAIFSTEPKYSRCTGSTVVTMATCGRTIFTKGVISPAWFMPISKIAYLTSAGQRASDSGTPQ